jgi:hypothetical protein
MRRNIVVLRTSMKAAAAVLAGGLAVSACGTVQMGAAAITGSSRISSSTLTSQVANLNAAYHTDQAKGVRPQRPRGQETQQVLTWLILFQVYDQMAAQHAVSVTSAQSQQALQVYAAQASQSHVTLDEYFSAGAALPPDLLADFGQAAAIQNVLVSRITGGKSPTTSAGQAAVSSQLGHFQCQAAKSLGIKVNPQYGEFNYNGYTVVPAPPTLAADPVPSPSPSPALLTPPC